MQFFPRVPKQVIRQLEPYFQHWKLLQYFRGNIPQFLLVSDALLQEFVDLFLVIFYVVNRENLRVGVPAQQSQVLICFVDQVLINAGHNGRTLALMREQDIALDFLDNFHHVYLFGGDDVADVGVYHCIFLEDFLIFEVNGLLALVLRVVVQGLKAEIFPVVDDICILADDDPLACLKLTDGDFIMVEEVLLVLLQFQEILRVRSSNILNVLRIGMLHP